MIGLITWHLQNSLSNNSSTQQTPFFANLGYHPTFDINITDRTTNPSATDLATRLKIIQSELRAELAHSNEYMAKNYNYHHLTQPHFEKLVTMCGYYGEIFKLHVLLTSLITVASVPSKSLIYVRNLLSFSNSLHPFLDFTPFSMFRFWSCSLILTMFPTAFQNPLFIT